MTLKNISKDTLKGSLLHKIVGDMREKEDAVAFPVTAVNPAAGLLEVEVEIEVQTPRLPGRGPKPARSTSARGS